MQNRRNLLYAGAAVAAAGAGAALALRQRGIGPSTSGKQDGNQEAADFWGLHFRTPEGQTLASQSFAGRPLLLNFWATWCPPCVQELPLIDSFYKQHQSKGWQVLGLAVDQEAPVRTWLAKSPLSFPVAMAGETGVTLSKALGNAAGGLPFSVVFSAAGTVLQRKSGRLNADELERWSLLRK